MQTESWNHPNLLSHQLRGQRPFCLRKRDQPSPPSNLPLRWRRHACLLGVEMFRTHHPLRRTDKTLLVCTIHSWGWWHECLCSLIRASRQVCMRSGRTYYVWCGLSWLAHCLHWSLTCSMKRLLSERIPLSSAPQHTCRLYRHSVMGSATCWVKMDLPWRQ